MAPFLAALPRPVPASPGPLIGIAMTESPQDPKRPSARQLRYIRDLANSKGETFIYPQTRAQASAEIDRLKRRRRSASSDRRRESSELSRELAAGPADAAAVRPEEISGFGSRATWR
jgi:hypothetical protein